MAQFEDELEDVVPAKTTTTTTTKATKPTVEDEAPAKASSSKKTAPVEDEDDGMDISLSFDDDKGLGGKGDGLNRTRPEKGKAKRFAFISGDLKAGKSHFVDGKGKFRCLTPAEGAHEPGYCCEKIGKDGDMHIVALVVEYTNADPKTGKYEKGTPIEWEIGFVDMSRSNLRAIKKLPEEDQKVTDIDIVMTHADRAFGYDFNKVSSKARWKQNPELVKEIEAAAQKFLRDGGKKLIGKLGKKASLMEWKQLLAGQATGAEESSIADLEDIE